MIPNFIQSPVTEIPRKSVYIRHVRNASGSSSAPCAHSGRHALRSRGCVPCRYYVPRLHRVSNLLIVLDFAFAISQPTVPRICTTSALVTKEQIERVALLARFLNSAVGVVLIIIFLLCFGYGCHRLFKMLKVYCVDPVRNQINAMLPHGPDKQ